MPESKRQHYLPEFYLNNFCREGLLWVYDRERNEYRPENGGIYFDPFTDSAVSAFEAVKAERCF